MSASHLIKEASPIDEKGDPIIGPPYRPPSINCAKWKIGKVVAANVMAEADRTARANKLACWVVYSEKGRCKFTGRKILRQLPSIV
ncbi:MAG: hypothetical protein C4325_14410 [Blastocatellia bacterium]